MDELNFTFKMPDDETLAKYISIKGEKGEKGDPTKLSELENDTGFVTASTDALANYYTKSQTDTALNSKVDNSTLEAIAIPDSFFTGEETIAESGTFIELENTADAVLKEVKFYGDTQQSGTPTPDSPVEIQVVTGDQTVVITDGDQQSQSYTLALGDLELCKVGNYQDYIYKSGNAWYIHKEVGKCNLKTDATNWIRQGANNNTYRFCVKVSQTDVPFLTNSSTAATLACNYFQAGSRSNTYSRQEKIALAESASSTTYLTFNMYIDSLRNETVDDFKAWLQSNEVIVYYQSTDPSDIEITDEALLRQLEAIAKARGYMGTTVVSISGTLAAQLYIEAYKNGWNGTISGINNTLDNKAGKKDVVQKPYYFDSVEEMKSYDFRAGDMAITTGYYAYNDGGAGKYSIVEGSLVVDNGSVIDLDNGLQAVLIVENDTVNVKQFGAKGDGTTDDTAAIQNALKYNENKPTIVRLINGETYIVDGNIYIYSNTTFDLDNAVIKDAPGAPETISYNKVQFMNNVASMTASGYGAIENFVVKNGTFDGNAGGVSFPLFHALNCRFENLNFYNGFVSTHIFDLAGCKNIVIKGCNFTGNLLSTESTKFREVIQPDYATYTSAPYWGNDESFAFDAIPTDGLTVDGCTFKKNDNDTYFLNAVGTHGINNDAHKNITVRNCEFYGCEYSNIRLPRVFNALIENNTFYSMNTRTGDNYAINFWRITNSSYTIVSSENITIKNNKYYATLETDDQIFIGIDGYDDDHLAKNIQIVGNEYNGTAVSEADYIGQDFSHIARADGVYFRKNIIRKAKHGIFKRQNEALNNLEVVGNTFVNTLRPIRGQGALATDTTQTPVGLIYEDNIIRTPLGSLNSSSDIIMLGLAEDLTLSGSTSDQRIPLTVISGYPLAAGSADNFFIPNFIRKFKVYGFICANTASGETVRWSMLRYWDRTKEERVYKTAVYEEEASVTSKTFRLNDLVVDEKDLDFKFDTNRLWTDGKYLIDLLVRVTGETTIYANKTQIFIEAW